MKDIHLFIGKVNGGDLEVHWGDGGGAVWEGTVHMLVVLGLLQQSENICLITHKYNLYILFWQDYTYLHK